MIILGSEMFKSKRKIKLITIYAAGSAILGLLLLFLILVFSLLTTPYTISFESIHTLYKAHNVFYMLNLIPVLLCLGGGFIGAGIFRKEEEANNKVSYYQGVIDQTVQFVQEIEKKNLNAPFVALNGEKVLETAMEAMRRSLITSSRKEFERNEINKITSEVSALLQTFNDINTLSEEIITFLVKKLDNVVQGAFYVVEGESEQEKIIRMKASYAYNRKKYMHSEFKFAQGLVGQAAIEKEAILRTEIPDDYMTITSGLLGDTKPTSILITPLITNEIVYGVIELAAFQKFTPLQCNIINELSDIIARTIANVKINNRTYTLLQESEKMSTELRYQKRQLLQNAEDLIKTQEELKESNIKLEEQIQEVHDTSKKTQVLLENSKEVITIFSSEGKIIICKSFNQSNNGLLPC